MKFTAKILTLALLIPALLSLPAQASGGYADTSLVERLPYVGDAAGCRMTAPAAETYAQVIRSTPGAVVKAALFDGGSGVPMLWVAHGDGWDSDLQALTGTYGDSVYTFVNGELQQCKWITSLLRPGSDGVVMQMYISEVSDHVSKFRLLRLNNGQIADEPFATGESGPFEGGFINGNPVTAPGTGATVYDLAAMIEYDLEVYLDAQSGLADMLFLTGNWGDGAHVASVLDELAADAAAPAVSQDSPPPTQEAPAEDTPAAVITPAPAQPAGHPGSTDPAPEPPAAEVGAEAPDETSGSSADDAEEGDLPDLAIVLITLGAVALAAAAVVLIAALRKKRS